MHAIYLLYHPTFMVKTEMRTSILKKYRKGKVPSANQINFKSRNKGFRRVGTFTQTYFLTIDPLASPSYLHNFWKDLILAPLGGSALTLRGAIHRGLHHTWNRSHSAGHIYFTNIFLVEKKTWLCQTESFLKNLGHKWPDGQVYSMYGLN